MRLNPDCVRDILLEMETAGYQESILVSELALRLTKYSSDEINYAIFKMKEANLISANITRDLLGVRPYSLDDITYAGHQFLANIREDNIWKGVKGVAKKVGSTSIDAFTQIASNVITELIKAQFGIGGINLPNMQ